jgi:hypothetical protein
MRQRADQTLEKNKAEMHSHNLTVLSIDDVTNRSLPELHEHAIYITFRISASSPPSMMGTSKTYDATLVWAIYDVRNLVPIVPIVQDDLEI